MILQKMSVSVALLAIIAGFLPAEGVLECGSPAYKMMMKHPKLLSPLSDPGESSAVIRELMQCLMENHYDFCKPDTKMLETKCSDELAAVEKFFGEVSSLLSLLGKREIKEGNEERLLGKRHQPRHRYGDGSDRSHSSRSGSRSGSRSRSRSGSRSGSRSESSSESSSESCSEMSHSHSHGHRYPQRYSSFFWRIRRRAALGGIRTHGTLLSRRAHVQVEKRYLRFVAYFVKYIVMHIDACTSEEGEGSGEGKIQVQANGEEEGEEGKAEKNGGTGKGCLWRLLMEAFMKFFSAPEPKWEV